MVSLVNRVGPSVSGGDFFGRDVEVPLFIERLKRGDHVSLIAQRRIGKSSLLKEVKRRLDGEFACIYVDLQGCNDAGDAVVAMALAAREHTGLWSRIHQTFANVLGNVESVGAGDLQIQLRDGVIGDWRAKGDRVLADLAGGERPVVLLLDELPILLVHMLREVSGVERPGGRDEAERFLSWLRKGALAHTGTLRVVVTGSIGLEPIARQVGLSGTLNIYSPFTLEPWTAEVGEEALAALAKGAKLTLEADARRAVIDHLGSCIPYHVQLFFSYLSDDAGRHQRAKVEVADVERVYKTRMLSSQGHAELAQMEERLRPMVPAAHLPLTLDLLTEAAVRDVLTTEAAVRLARDNLGAGVKPQDVLGDLFGVLEHDGYLGRGADGGRRFVSRLLKDWWRARHGEFFVPAHLREIP